MHTHRHGCRQKDAYQTTGFTLVELLVTLSIVLLLAMFAVETMPRFVQESRMVSEVNQFVTALHLGRAEAIKYGRNVVLCPSPDRDHCSNSKDWPVGWILFPSDDREHDPGEPVLQAGNPMENGIGMTAGNYRKRIVFRQDGSSGGSNASFTFCERRHLALPRVICLSDSGRPRLTYTTCGRRPIVCP